VGRVRAAGTVLRLVGFGVKASQGSTPYDEFHENPPQEQLAAIYSGADIYLCPSWDEGLGMPAMEAMACGAMLVTYDNGGCRDYARDGETALVARHRDVADLTAKLDLALADEPLRRRIADAGRAFVTTAFDWDKAVVCLEAMLAGNDVSNAGH
jgi:glycosyltransferase involved in cell wall biosynthesis